MLKLMEQAAAKTPKEAAESVCQSCGMPLTDPTDYGTNADGTPNTEYCAYCYQDGQFTDPDATLDSKAAFVAKFTAERQGISIEDAIPATKERLSQLKRWNSE